MKQISIVMPLIGACEWLTETLESIEAQSFPHDAIETIILTDGKGADNVSRAREFLAERGMTAVAVIDATCSASTARNKGWRLASSEWIQFLEAGDVLAPAKLEVQAALIPQLADDVDVVCSQWRNLRHWNGAWQPFGSAVRPVLAEPLALRLVSAPVLSFGPVLIRRAALERVGGISQGVEFSAAEHLLLKLAGSGSRFVEERSDTPQFLLRQLPREQSRADKIASARQRVENMLAAESILGSRSRAALTTNDAEELDKLANARLNALYWLDSAVFAQYCDRLKGAAPAQARAAGVAGRRGSDTGRAKFGAAAAALAGRASGWHRALGEKLASGARSVVRLPTAGLLALAAGVTHASAWALDKISTAMWSVIGAALWVVRLPVVAWRRLVAGVVSALAAVSRAIDAALQATGRAVSRGVDLVAALWSETAGAVKRAVAAAIDALRAVVRGILWVLRLPVVAARAVAAGVLRITRWLGRTALSMYRSTISAVVWLFLLPLRLLAWLRARLVAAAAAFAGLLRPRYIGIGALAACSGIIAAGALLVSEPAGRFAKTSTPRVSEASRDAAPVRLAEAAPRSTSDAVVATGAGEPAQAVPAAPLPDQRRDEVVPEPVPAAALEKAAETPPAQVSVARAEPPPQVPAISETPTAPAPVETSPPPAPAIDPKGEPQPGAEIASSDRAPEAAPAEESQPGAAPSPPTGRSDEVATPADDKSATGAQTGQPPVEPAPSRESTAVLAPALGDTSQPATPAKPQEVPVAEPAALPPPVEIATLDEVLPRVATLAPAPATEQRPEDRHSPAATPTMTTATAEPAENESDKPNPAATAVQQEETSAAPPAPPAVAVAEEPPTPPALTPTVPAAPPAPEATASIDNAPPAIPPSLPPSAADKPDTPSAPPRAAAVERQAAPPATAVAPVSNAPSATSVTPARDAPFGPSWVPIEPKAKERADRLVVRGERSLAEGNVAQARQFFLHAANAGHARAAFLLASTYDARELVRLAVVGVQPDSALARRWYERARELGFADAAESLERLGAP